MAEVVVACCNEVDDNDNGEVGVEEGGKKVLSEDVNKFKSDKPLESFSVSSLTDYYYTSPALNFLLIFFSHTINIF